MSSATTTLNFNVFTAPEKAFVGDRPHTFGPPLAWDPITSTLIYGEDDAVIIDALTTAAEAAALADWIALHHRNLTTIYITHGHFDHFYGVSVLLDRFPAAKAIATPASVELMARQMSGDFLRSTQRRFPGQLPANIVAPQPFTELVFTLEGHELRIIKQGRTDAEHTTSVYVPDLDLVVGGDVVYNQCHMMSGTPPRTAGLTGSPPWSGCRL